MADNQNRGQFTMYNTRIAISSGLAHIEKQVEAIELAITQNPTYVFDLAKTIVESTCKTILKDRDISFEAEENLPKLFKTVVMNLPFLPVSASADIEARRSLERTLNGLHTALQGVCELRNKHGFSSHGKEGDVPALGDVQALLAAQTADTIVGFFHRVHLQDRTATLAELSYQDNPDVNDYIDEENAPVFIFEFEYKPSEVLFAVDLNAYRALLSEFIPSTDSPEEPTSSNAAGAAG